MIQNIITISSLVGLAGFCFAYIAERQENRALRRQLDNNELSLNETTGIITYKKKPVSEAMREYALKEAERGCTHSSLSALKSANEAEFIEFKNSKEALETMLKEEFKESLRKDISKYIESETEKRLKKSTTEAEPDSKDQYDSNSLESVKRAVKIEKESGVKTVSKTKDKNCTECAYYGRCYGDGKNGC